MPDRPRPGGTATGQPGTPSRLQRPEGDENLRNPVSLARSVGGEDGGVGEILVGTASWTDKTLLESGWYPPDVTNPEQRLRFYAEQFPLVEVDSTYYTPPNERNSELWAARTPPEFRFNVKAFSLLTQHPTKVSALYKDVRPDTDKRNVYAKDLHPKIVDEVWDRFLSALEPLHDAGKLGALLFQFPQWFTIR